MRQPTTRPLAGLAALNKTSIKPGGYGERFVKRRGLFCLAGGTASRCRFGCVSRQDNDRSAVHQLDQDRSAGERAEATRSLARAWLISDLSEDDRAAAEGALLMLLDDASPLVRQAMAEVFARSAEAPGRDRAGAVARPALGRASRARTFPAADRRRPRRHRRDRRLRNAMRDRPPRQSAGLGLRRDRRSRQRRRGARTDRKSPTPSSRRFPGTASSSGTAISPRSGNRCWCWRICRPRRAPRWSPNSRRRWRSSWSPGTG